MVDQLLHYSPGITLKLIKYICFAIAATILNLGLQWFFLKFYYGANKLFFAIFIGTLSGLIFKYWLDKNYIFNDKTKNQIINSKKFIIYTLFGSITTIIFGGFEYLFDFLIKKDYGKYLGATIGLSFGYLIKYYLDKNFVFKKE